MLHAKLLERQIELGLRDDEMAAKIGLPRTTYSSIKTERHRISLPVARRIVAAFPDLAEYVLAVEPEPPPKTRRPVDPEERAVKYLEARGYQVTRLDP